MATEIELHDLYKSCKLNEVTFFYLECIIYIIYSSFYFTFLLLSTNYLGVANKERGKKAVLGTSVENLTVPLTQVLVDLSDIY